MSDIYILYYKNYEFFIQDGIITFHLHDSKGKILTVGRLTKTDSNEHIKAYNIAKYQNDLEEMLK